MANNTHHKMFCGVFKPLSGEDTPEEFCPLKGKGISDSQVVIQTPIFALWGCQGYMFTHNLIKTSLGTPKRKKRGFYE
jgi:hypothetical protein